MIVMITIMKMIIINRRTNMTWTIENPGRDEVQALFIKSALKLIKVGIKPARHLTKTKLMAKAGMISGVKYKRNEIDKAIDDMDKIVQLHKGNIFMEDN